MSNQPNIIIIMADQIAASVLPFYTPSVVKTPNLMTLAERGVVFDSAYCNSPLCAPSRYVLMSGKLPTAIGAYDNAADLPADTPTFAHYLRQAGYLTVLAGKMHFCGPDQLHGYERRLTTDIYPADYGWFPNWEAPDHLPTWYHNMSSITQAGICVRSNQLDFDDEVVFHAQRCLYDYVRGSDTRPLCLTVSMTHPHDPYTITREYWDKYKAEDIDLPKIDLAAAQQDPHSRRLRRIYQADTTIVTEAQILNARRAYYGAISYIDDQVGKLLETLRETRLADNSIIVFTGDHGDMLGERGLWYKMSWFENSARVPLIVHAPNHFSAHRVKESISTMDLLPTLAAIAHGGGEPEYAVPIDGRSLLPHLQGTDGHDEVIGEYLGEGAVAPLCMIRRGPHKFICSPPDPDQLFNLERDPEELTNLASHPACAELMADFHREASNRWDMEAITRDVILSQRRRRLIAAALKRGEQTPWDYQPVSDASTMYMRNNIDLDDLEGRARFPDPSTQGT